MYRKILVVLSFYTAISGMQKELFIESMILAIKSGNFEKVQELGNSKLFNPLDVSFWKYNYLHIGCYPITIHNMQSSYPLCDTEFSQSLEDYTHIIKFLIEKGVSYSAKNDDHETPLMRWIADSLSLSNNLKKYSLNQSLNKVDYIKKIKKIYKNSIHTLAPYNTSESFFYLSYSKYPKLISLLIEAKAQVNECDKEGNTLLHRCVHNYNDHIVEEFLSLLPTEHHKKKILTLLLTQKCKKAEFPKPLCWKIIYSLLSPLQLYLLKEQKITKEYMLMMKNRQNKTALDVACDKEKLKNCRNNSDVIKLQHIISLLKK